MGGDVYKRQVMASVRFAVNRSMAYKGQETQIYEVARYLREHPKAVVRIEGYADATSGSEDYNHKLAQQRAEYVRKQLVDTYKADASRIETKACLLYTSGGRKREHRNV